MKFFLLITLVSIYLRGAKSADTDTCSLLQSNMNKTETMMTKTNDLLERSIELLEGIKKQGEDKTYDNLTQVQSQIAQQIRGGRCLFFLTMRCFNDAMFSNS